MIKRSENRRERLAKALRENLQKRKEQKERRFREEVSSALNPELVRKEDYESLTGISSSCRSRSIF
jgi:hypothetical protein